MQIYDPKSAAFIPHPESTAESPALDLRGPFTYFLSTVNIDRLEPQFRISPLARAIAPPPATCDIVVLRPLRDPSVKEDTEDARKEYVAKVWKVLGGAYQDGAHVGFTYDEASGEIEVNGEGPVVIEYFRAGGWEWVPVSVFSFFRGLAANVCLCKRMIKMATRTSSVQMVRSIVFPEADALGASSTRSRTRSLSTVPNPHSLCTCVSTNPTNSPIYECIVLYYFQAF